MSYEIISTTLNKFNLINNWKACLIHYNHEKFPNEYICYPLNFSPTTLIKEIILEQRNSFLKTVDKYDRIVQPYTGYNPKNIVDKLNLTDELVTEQWISIIQHMIEPDDTTELQNIKANAYIFYGTYLDENNTENNIYLLTRKNPIVSYKKSRHIFTSLNNTISTPQEPIIHFNKCFDALIINSTAYMINLNCESIFNMAYSHKLICQRTLTEIQHANIINNFEAYSTFALSAQNPKKFFTYDRTILANLADPTFRTSFANSLSIPYDANTNKLDLSNETDAKHFTSAICGKIKKDFFNDVPCEVPTSTPLTFH